MLLQILLSSDWPTNSSQESKLREEKALLYQQNCMERLVGLLLSSVRSHESALIHMRLISPEARDGTNPCEWSGVFCRGNFVHAIEWSRRSEDFYQPYGFHEIMTHWLPSSVRQLHLGFMPVHHNLVTRYLPARLEVAAITGCNLTGSIDMDSLPKTLVTLSLAENRYAGTIKISELPPKIRIVSFSRNSVAEVHYRGSLLPASLEKLYFLYQRDDIAVRMVDLDSKVTKKSRT